VFGVGIHVINNSFLVARLLLALTGVIDEGWMDNAESPSFGFVLQTDQGYGTTCVLASIDE